MKLITFIFTLLFSLNASFSNAKEDLQCLSLESNNVSFLGDKNSGLYTEEGHLLYVFPSDGNYNLKNFKNKKVCYNSSRISLIQLSQNKTEKEVLLSKNKNIYISSIFILIYSVLIAVFIILYKKNEVSIFNVVKVENADMILLIPLLILIAFSLNFLITGEFFNKFFVLMFLIFMIKIISSNLISKFFNIENNTKGLLLMIFKILNYILLGLFVLKYTIQVEVTLKSLININFYILLVVFTISTLFNFIKSDKNWRLTHLFYYLCALEILPMLFLKEYYLS